MIRMNEKTNDYYRMIMIGTLVAGLVLMAIGLIFHTNKYAWVKGVTFGTIFTAIKLVLINRTANKVVDMNRSDATRHTMGQYTIRYLLTGGVLLISILDSSIDMWAVFFSLFTTKIAIYVLLMMGKINK